MSLGRVALCIVASFALMIYAGEKFLPHHFEFWLALFPLVMGYVWLYKYCEEHDII